jgi:hypothetical protein
VPFDIRITRKAENQEKPEIKVELRECHTAWPVTRAGVLVIPEVKGDWDGEINLSAGGLDRLTYAYPVLGEDLWSQLFPLRAIDAGKADTVARLVGVSAPIDQEA